MRSAQGIRPIARVAAVLMLVVSLSSAALACPTCKLSLENDEHQQDVARGYYYSIVFMMSMPFLIVGSFGASMFVAVHRERKKQESQAKEVVDEFDDFDDDLDDFPLDC